MNHMISRRIIEFAKVHGAIDSEFADTLAAYQREFGDRIMGREMDEPTMAERPTFVLGLIKDQIRQGFEPGAQVAALAQARLAAEVSARGVLAGHPVANRDRFEQVLASAQKAYPVRDDTVFYHQVAAGLLRYAVLGIARRLVISGRLAKPEDVFFLELTEVRSALHEGVDQQPLVTRRQGEGSVGALVTDTGGLLSHPAIIAREFGIPAVLATKTATGTLRDGQIVTVDGDTGLVEIVI